MALHQLGSRRMFPRWRMFRQSLAAGELDSLAAKAPVKQQLPDESLEDRLRAWRDNPSDHGLTAELLSQAMLMRKEDVLTEVLNKSSGKTSLPERLTAIIQSAESLLQPDEGMIKPVGVLSPEQLRAFIHLQRRSSRIYPHDAIGQIEMAWNYLVIGRRDKAERCVQWALKVAPSNRYVLRSACRYYIHCSELERAKRLLVKSGLTKSDPWIAAALVSVEQALKKAPSQIRPLHALGLNQNISPLARSELLAALADFHNGEGERKRSKKLFNEALLDPTDNALAQAINWISADAHEEGSKILKLAHVNAPYEAETVVHYYNKDWDHCLDQVRLWRVDQPFSGRPYIFQSFLLSVVKEDFGSALQVAHDGLVVDPDDETLRNNQAFSLINLGKYDDAHKILSATPTGKLTRDAQVAYAATSGLYLFRTARSVEQITDARNLYVRATAIAKRDVTMKFRGQIAAMFELMEEIRWGIAISADELKKVETLAQKTRDPAVAFLSNKVLSTIKAREKTGLYPSKLDPTGTFELPPPVKLDFPE